MSCPHCKNTAITGMLHGCSIIYQDHQERKAEKPRTNSFVLKCDDKELDKLIDEVSEDVEY